VTTEFVETCPFCRTLDILETVGEVVWQFAHSVALLGTWQYYHGYCVLVSRRHASELSELADEVRRAYLDEMCLLARAIETTFHPHKLNYELLGNQVQHLHWHIFPRYLKDPDRLRPAWLAIDRAEHDEELKRHLETGPLDRAATVARLRHTLDTLGAPVP
jgi:diadenosine tetraphosphate (Ap4A) HIT family hydrolase